jgi:hypothetical protein
MRKLVAGTFLTLDGVMQAPGAPDEDREGGFRHGGRFCSKTECSMPPYKTMTAARL